MTTNMISLENAQYRPLDFGCLPDTYIVLGCRAPALFGMESLWPRGPRGLKSAVFLETFVCTKSALYFESPMRVPRRRRAFRTLLMYRRPSRGRAHPRMELLTAFFLILLLTEELAREVLSHRPSGVTETPLEKNSYLVAHASVAD